jgi:hypothetical protein
LSATEFAGLTRAPLERGSLFSILKRDYGLELAYADEERLTLRPRICEPRNFWASHAASR